MKNIVVKFKKGYVGYAHNLNGTIHAEKLTDVTPFGFEKQANTPDPGIYNVFWELDKIMREAITYVKANPSERVQIAVPGTVWALANNIDMLTRMMWTGKNLYTTVQDEKTHRTILINRKTTGPQKQTGLSEAEFVMYKRLFMNMKQLMGYGLVIDSQFIASKENAKTADAITLAELNEACNEVLGIGVAKADGVWGNLAATAGGGLDASMPVLEDGDDMPF